MTPPARRDFLKLTSAGLVSGGPALLGGCGGSDARGEAGSAPGAAATDPASLPEDTFDYVVVGSGAGGGPLAANLALAGYKVLLLEAGGDEEPWDYQVPAFHALSTEDDALRWSFYVRHYADDAQQRRDRKFVREADGAIRDGILYPRAGTLGGCTAHNAMILVYPHNSDWELIVRATGDPSWGAESMRRYFERMERCEYRTPPAAGPDPARHGYDGWLTTNTADPKLLARDKALARVVAATLKESGASNIRNPGDLLARIKLRLANQFDPNDWRWVQGSYTGLTFTPLTTRDGRRTGARERVREARALRPEHLIVRTHALTTRVLLDSDRRAVGVEYLHAPHLYRADPAAPAGGPLPASRTARVMREVILAGGAFNTPQLLMLSGIGPREELEPHGIPVAVELPGVGCNLQDRYEVCVVSTMKGDFRILEGASFRPPADGEAHDRAWSEWLQGGGVYTTNGAIIAAVGRSAEARPEPDLYVFGLAGRFEGYEPGYSKLIAQDRNYFSWAVLKAHTNNTAGRVRLRSADPRDTPLINFHYFQEGNDPEGDDLESVAAGVELVRRIMARVPSLVDKELLPGPEVRTREQVRQYVRDNAWGHHASCTCKIGAPDDPTAVLDARFRVRGTRGLRVVDASVFPRIPGFFIVSAVYMVSEKASDVILEDAPTWV
jgi:choline dehydrogenase